MRPTFATISLCFLAFTSPIRDEFGVHHEFVLATNRDEKGSSAIYQPTNNSEQSQIVCDRVKPLPPCYTISKVICFSMFAAFFLVVCSFRNPMSVSIAFLRFFNKSTISQSLSLSSSRQLALSTTHASFFWSSARASASVFDCDFGRCAMQSENGAIGNK